MALKTLKTGSRNSREALREHDSRSQRFGFLKRRLANMDVEEVWAALEADLTVGVGRKDPEKLGRALDAVDGSLRRAGMIHQIAVDEYDEYLIDWRSAYSEWETRARKALSTEMKGMKGQVTTAVIENWIARNISDYRKWEKVRLQLARTKHLAENMKKVWESRAASLRKMADLVTPRRGMDTENLPRRRDSRRD